MKTDNLQFLGSASLPEIIGDAKNSNCMSASMLLVHGREHNINIFILLLDSYNYIADTEFMDAVVVSWKPFQVEWLHVVTHDFWAARNCYAVATLASFAKESIETLMTVENSIGSVPTHVDCTPHHIN